MQSSSKKDPYDFLFRVVLTGDSGVGKTNLLFRYTKNEYLPDLPATIGIDFSVRNILIDGRTIRAHIWDTAGQDKFKSISTTYYRGSAVALLVYDITNYESFKNANDWLKDLRKYADENIVVTLVGNKCDLKEFRKVSTKEALQFAEENQLSFIETSALDSTNVEMAFINSIIEAYYIRVKNEKLESVENIISFKKMNTIKLPETVDQSNNKQIKEILRDKSECC